MQSRRLLQLPPPPALPPAYAALLRDPALSLDSACGALLSPTQRDETSATTTPTTEQHAARMSPQPFPTRDQTTTANPPDARAASWLSTSEITRPPSAPAVLADTAQTTRTAKSRLPISLVSRTPQPDNPTSVATPPASNHVTTDAASATTQKVSTLRRANAGELLDWSRVLQASRSREDSSASSFAAVAPERRVAPTETMFQSRAVSRGETSRGVELKPVRASSDVITAPSPLLREDARHASEEDGHSSGVQFTPQHSRLAALLNANLATQDEATPSIFPSQTKAIDAPRRTGDSFDGFKRREADATENHTSDSATRENADGSRRRDEARLVEAVLDELYERFELEFLRAYGTSGE
ncbi:MAG TPA: hypothetical protein VF666_10315 [Pyrinomonadaceae bacterium]